MLDAGYVDFEAQYADQKADILAIVEDVFRAGRFVNGPRIAEFEEALAVYLQTDHVVAVSNGTDALVLAMRLLGVGPGDEVITVANSFVATVAAIVQVGATPVLVDVGDDLNIAPTRWQRRSRSGPRPSCRCIGPAVLPT